MDADQDDVFLAEGGAMGVYAACTLFEGDIRFFRNKELGIKASVLKIQDYAFCDFTIEFVFEEASVRTAFAGSVGAVAGVKKDCHCTAGFMPGSSRDSGGKDTKGFRETRIFGSPAKFRVRLSKDFA